ncbi:GNAT family protein [Xanthobacter sp. DSM 24535]|uniref:GNAT family N-acetyltransferase n=1 Tax=Roseixanthobacter psychrophilus TaxID=3119917 RepID=UPI00372A62CA
MSRKKQPLVVRVPVSGARHLVYNDDARVIAWASEHIGQGEYWPQDTVSIGLERDGRLLAAALFNSFSGAACQGHIASDGSRAWATRDVLAAVFAFPFVQSECQRITAPIAASNKPSLILAIKLGFVPEGRMERALPDDDLAVLVMFKERCPWLPRVEG